MKDEIVDNTENYANKSPEEQEIMAFLRARYLNLLSSLCDDGLQCDVAMYENTEVKCNLKAFDLDFENVIVENLVTPSPIPVKIANLRTNDIISMKFKCDSRKYTK